MNIQQAEILLEKINRLFKSMKMDEDNISRIEKDLMIKYIRDYYELFIPDEEYDAPAKPQPIVKTYTRKAKKEVRDPEFDNIPEEEEEIVAPVKKVIHTPEPVTRVIRKKRVEVVQTPPAPEPEPEPVAEITPPVPEPEPVIFRTSTRATGIKEAHEVIFETQKTSTDIADRLSALPIKNLTKAFSINDRILTQNDLFDGDRNGFNKTLEDLNDLDSFEEAKVYLSQNAVDKYEWTAKNKVKSARDFIQLVSRKFK